MPDEIPPLRSRTRFWDWIGDRVGAAWGHSHARLGDAKLIRILADCVAGTGGEASARSRVATLAAAYRGQDDAGKCAFLALLAKHTASGDDPPHALVDDYLQTSGTARRLAALRLRAALEGASLRLLRQFNLLEDGVKFLVDLRADAIRLAPGNADVRVIAEALLLMFRDWFAVGNLELRRITWSSPAALLERLMAYEAVHEILSWGDLRHRLESDRRCYAFFHPRMPDEPLVFVEVALTRQVASSIEPLLDESTPVIDPREASVAVFYSISSTQPGLRGVSFGGFLIKRVVERLLGEYPRLATFATLSPAPRFRQWLDERVKIDGERLLPHADRVELAKLGNGGADAALRRALAGEFGADGAAGAAVKSALMSLCARYLVLEQDDGTPIDPVARFHFGNGARLDRLNWRADTSARGMRQSLGIMVNYMYEPAEIEDNHEAYFCDGKVATSAGVRRLLRRVAGAADTGKRLA